MHLLTVGEMARLNHVSEQTLRLYDREGLLCPCVRKENGYRYYDIKQSVELDVIQYMKSLGISLKEIRQQLKTRDIEGVERRCATGTGSLWRKCAALQCRRSAVRRTLGKPGFLPFGLRRMAFFSWNTCRRARPMYWIPASIFTSTTLTPMNPFCAS